MTEKKKVFFGLDLDETLIYSHETFKSKTDADPSADFYIYDKDHPNCIEYEVFERPNLHLLLNKINSEFNMFFFTRAERTYAQNIVNELGFSDLPLFSREHTDIVKDIGPYSSGSTYELKRLDKIAKVLGTDLEHLIFIDDVVNMQAIHPIDNVIKISKFHKETIKDNEFSKLLNFLNTLDGSSVEIVSKLKNFNFDNYEQDLKEDTKRNTNRKMRP